MPFERSLMTVINWDARLIAIRGARGVGKTTMLLQYIKKRYGTSPTVALYASLDQISAKMMEPIREYGKTHEANPVKIIPYSE